MQKKRRESKYAVKKRRLVFQILSLVIHLCYDGIDPAASSFLTYMFLHPFLLSLSSSLAFIFSLFFGWGGGLNGIVKYFLILSLTHIYTCGWADA